MIWDRVLGWRVHKSHVHRDSCMTQCRFSFSSSMDTQLQQRCGIGSVRGLASKSSIEQTRHCRSSKVAKATVASEVSQESVGRNMPLQKTAPTFLSYPTQPFFVETPSMPFSPFPSLCAHASFLFFGHPSYPEPARTFSIMLHPTNSCVPTHPS